MSKCTLSHSVTKNLHFASSSAVSESTASQKCLLKPLFCCGIFLWIFRLFWNVKISQIILVFTKLTYALPSLICNADCLYTTDNQLHQTSLFGFNVMYPCHIKSRYIITSTKVHRKLNLRKQRLSCYCCFYMLAA